MDFLTHLNPEQRDAVLHRDGPLLILAGAGSGKTRVITYRIAYLIGDGPARACGRIWLSPFHALCARLLRREGPAIGLSRDFVIYDSSDQLAVVRQVMRELDIDERLLAPRPGRGRTSAPTNR